ncbi:putative phage gene [Moritella sp. PE36]|uniref:ogr/Delta-like zinc finger family protein n=1 Tax=Moritella sp. PE36 TaxID=58051 RepID=UPI00015689A9|nr:ogr/Delta-like zinc finger family protein [Moritella sp. PE36]EDM67324.1 putative phage gene [Moritella sp. PE36]
MRVTCKFCKGKARISSTDKVSVEFTRLYCQCLDAKCGHTFVMDLGFSHTLNPPSNIVDQLLVDRVRQMPVEIQRELFGLV